MLEQLFYLIRSAEKMLRTEGAAFKLSPLFFRTVTMILKRPEMTADMLSKSLVADKALVARTLTELEERKLIKRKRNPNDRRSFLLVPTAELLAMKDTLLRLEKDTETFIVETAKKEGIKLC
jgi:DNA-binding MarR family transcriptional regulator